ncbi:MAG: N-acetylmuramoyl-L-alanine amidase [Eubacterium sp.]|nr:N-acetylmuramoyl-L-alanine amidase [Eubacterium sp.]
MKKLFIILILVLAMLVGCAGKDTVNRKEASATKEDSVQHFEQQGPKDMETGSYVEMTEDPGKAEEDTSEEYSDTRGQQSTTWKSLSDSEEKTSESGKKRTGSGNRQFLVVIDPGHQQEQNKGLEPVGPGSSEKKQKVSSGTSGVSTGLDEYQLNLEVSLKLKEELEDRGYKVIMTRETNDVDISNVERAQIANRNHADAFIRIHANGDDNRSVHGMMTLCQTPHNPYNGKLYKKSRALAEAVLDKAVEKTDAKKLYIYETDTMSGINWAEVPCTIFEMGYMSNPREDEKMSTDSYQEKIVRGVADGIDAFLQGRKK